MTHLSPAVDTLAANYAVLLLACGLGLLGIHNLPLRWELRVVISIVTVPLAAWLATATKFDVDCRWFHECAH